MRVAVYYSNRDIRIENRPVPRIGPGELLMRVEACGICGSDALEWYRIKKAPLVLGHEFAGVVESVGEGADRFKPGDRVAVTHHVPCGECHYCTTGHPTVCDTLRFHTHVDPGGFAEYCRVPAINVEKGTFLLPDGMSYEDATFMEPLGCVLRGQRLADLRPACSVVILGSGIAGLMHVMAARAAGAGFIMATDVEPYRLDAARRFGADLAVDARADLPGELRKASGRLAGVVIVSTGAASAAAQALQLVDRGGTVLYFASTDPGVTTPLSINDFFWRRDTTIATTYAAAPEDCEAAIDLIHTGRMPLHDMITHRLPLAECSWGFQAVASGRDSMKVIVFPQT